MKDYTDAELAQILDKDIFHMISEAADSLGLECYVVGDMSVTSSSKNHLMILTAWWWLLTECHPQELPLPNT